MNLKNRLLTVAAALVALMVPLLTSAEEKGATAAASDQQVVVFMCPYGGAKSVVAASYFNRVAEQEGLPFTAVAVAAEQPYDAVPAKVADYMERQGFAVRSFKPRRVEHAEIRSAAKVVSIDCDLSKLKADDVQIEAWNDVPKMSEDLDGSVDAIRKHVWALAARLKEQTAP